MSEPLSQAEAEMIRIRIANLEHGMKILWDTLNKLLKQADGKREL